MSSSPSKPTLERPVAIEIQPSSPRLQRPTTTTSTTEESPRKVAIPIDLSDESAYAIQWAVQNYLRPNDSVTLVHVRPTSVLYGADWGSTHFAPSADHPDPSSPEAEESKKNKLEEDFNTFTAAKIAEIAEPLSKAKIAYKVHVVKDHDMKERLCLEIERLGMSVVIMGSRGFGASRRTTKEGRLGSVSDYCVHHCFCPVVVVRFPGERESAAGSSDVGSLHPVPEEDSALPQDDLQPHHLHKD